MRSFLEEGRKPHLMKIAFLFVFTGLEHSLQIGKEIYFEARLNVENQLFLLDVKFEAVWIKSLMYRRNSTF